MIIIDPGHGGSDSGAVSAGRTHLEKNLNLDMAKKIANKLAGKVKVSLTRETDKTLDPAPRTKIVRQSGARLCLSLHHNAFNGSARGAEVIHSINSDGRLAKLIYNGIVAAGMPKRRIFSKESGSYPGKDYYFMIRDTAPVETVIIEFGFIDNAEDLKLITNPNMQDRMADAVVKAVLEYLGVSKVNRVPTVVYYGNKELKCFIETDADGKNGVTYAPVRALAELLGLKVDFDGKNVRLTKGG